MLSVAVYTYNTIHFLLYTFFVQLFSSLI